MKPNDLGTIVTPSDPRVSGDRTAFVKTRIDVDGDRYVREIWIAEGGRSRRLTSGPGDHSPRWSPDGHRLAFARSVDKKPAQVAVIDVDGGEAEVVTDFDLGVEEMEWSPDGSRLAVVAVTWVDDWAGLDDEERARRPRRIVAVPYRFDQKGWTHDRKRHVWLVDPSGSGQPECLTPGEFDDAAIAWAPDGSRIGFVSDRSSMPGLSKGTDVWEVDLATRTTTRAVERGTWWQVTYRPDGVLHVVGNPEPRWPAIYGVYRREPDGSVNALTDHLDRSVISIAVGPGRFAWDGDHLYSFVEDAGKVGVMSIGPDGSVRHVIEGERTVTGFDVDGDRISFTATSTEWPPQLYERVGASESLTAAFGVDVEVAPVHHFRHAGVDVWVCLPPGDSSTPALLNIHGGPASQYGFGFFDEFQVYAGAGYGVVACNPRGSSGRGDEFLQAVTGEGWGTVDVTDTIGALEEALRRYPRLDGDRLGVMGGSYGGFLTAWLTARDKRFKSAVVERALLSWPSFSGTSDIGGLFATDYLRLDDARDWVRLWEASPLATADRVTCPTLVIHSESDLRCPIEQAEQYFMALLRNGTPAEFVRFPGEGHEMSRSGSPRHRVERFEAILAWHDRWLKP
ncbi:MAG: S9 family peptidase [Acidimicrobiia bacterium]|nr:S9 family peptidase [Acidimicrobiia bacterium]MDH4309310.1 S9 family peptidase [Acidimicrobiia bacterium]